MATKRKTTKKRPSRASYSDTFKAKAVQRVISGETQTAVAKDLGISQVTLSSWKRKFEKMASESNTPVRTERSSRAPKTTALPSDTVLLAMSQSDLDKLNAAAEVLLSLPNRVVELVRK